MSHLVSSLQSPRCASDIGAVSLKIWRDTNPISAYLANGMEAKTTKEPRYFVHNTYDSDYIEIHHTASRKVAIGESRNRDSPT